MCALRGHDLSLPTTRARVLYAMAGTKAEAVAAGAMSTVVETAAQALFVYLCSGVPGASMLPVGAAVSSLVDTEAAVAGKAGLADDFREGSRPVWKSTSELGYRGDLRQPERHRADAGMEATSRRWRGSSTPSSRCSQWWGARNLISTQGDTTSPPESRPQQHNLCGEGPRRPGRQSSRRGPVELGQKRAGGRAPSPRRSLDGLERLWRGRLLDGVPSTSTPSPRAPYSAPPSPRRPAGSRSASASFHVGPARVRVYPLILQSG